MADRLKIIRDPVFNYVAIDRDRDRFLLEILDSPEVQRLRSIRQLGVSCLTYPGATHTRLSHSLGVLHLMQQVVAHLERAGCLQTGPSHSLERRALLAVALLHDVGHGPFSHVLEAVTEINHEEWSRRIVTDDQTAVGRILRSVDADLPGRVAALLEGDLEKCSLWETAIVSSQLDVDRLDFVLRDSYFTGAGYGHYDWYRILNTCAPSGSEREATRRRLVWPETAKYALEEYIFARFYMYQAVYFHKTTRGFEKLLQSILRRVKDGECRATIREPLRSVLRPPNGSDPDLQTYLRVTESQILAHIEDWATGNEDAVLADLCKRFLSRRVLACIPGGPQDTTVVGDADSIADLRARVGAWAEAAEYVRARGFDPEYYWLEDDGRVGIYEPYGPEKEPGEQGPKQAIHIDVPGRGVMEISQHLERLQNIAGKKHRHVRWYCPKERVDIREMKKILKIA